MSAAAQARATEVYPRPRGEYSSSMFWLMNITGLPPPTRGILVAGKAAFANARSTPAHAGNTGVSSGNIAIATVYPRPRGEYVLIGERLDQHGGLPPPTRGIRAAATPILTLRRSTPAHAGNTVRCRRCLDKRKVYPRPRGEYM